MQKPSLGRIVLVTPHSSMNAVRPAETAPAVVCKVFSVTTINARVLTDSAEIPPWCTSLLYSEEERPGTWRWPPREDAGEHVIGRR